MKKPLYIILANYFPRPDSWRCAYGYDYAKAIKDSGRFDVKVVVPWAKSDYIYKEIDVYTFRTFGLGRGLIPDFCFYKINQERFLNMLARTGIAVSDIAIVEAYNANLGFYGWSIKKLNPRVRLLQHHHDLQSASWGVHPWLYRVMNFWWVRKMYESQDLHVFLSDLSRKSLALYPNTDWVPEGMTYKASSVGLRWMRPTRVKDSYVLHNGVNRKIFKPKRETDGHVFSIGVVANLYKLKGVDTLLKAVSLLKGKIEGLQVRIIGSGPQKEPLETCIRENGLEDIVSFLPEVEHEQLARFYNQIDIFVMPSYFEGFGCVYTEAWNCGTPFIACKDGNGIIETMDPAEQEKWLVKKDDYQDLALKILYYQQHRDRQRLIVETDIDILVSRFLDYVQKKVLPQ